MNPEYPAADIELMERIAEFDSKSLEALYNRYSPLLYTLIKRIVENKTFVEEVLSDVFVIIWRKIDLFDFNSRNVYTWLILLTRNKAVDYLRRKKDPGSLPEYSEEYENEFILPRLSPLIDPLDLRTTENIQDSVEKAFTRLTDAQQYVINLAFYGGLTREEIAAKLKIPLPTVESKISLALNSFKDNLIKGDR